jgi:hypothetical protein
MVRTKDVAWHAGNWFVNTHAIGLENEGFALDGSYFTPQLYKSMARLTRYLGEKYNIPLDREHIIGHDQVPGPTAAFQLGMHWDPGTFFDWARFMALMGAPLDSSNAEQTGRIVTIDPNFATNQPTITGCDANGCRTWPKQPANFVYLYTSPSTDSPLVGDPLLAGSGLEPNGVGTTRADDWGDKTVTGQSFAVAERKGDWIAIWYGGQKAWLQSPRAARTTIDGGGTLVTPKAGLATIPVYGRAYPSSVSVRTLGYTIPAGQVYVAKDLMGADYYDAPTFTLNPADHTVVKGNERFYEISFNHRLAFVKSTDVQVVG